MIHLFASVVSMLADDSLVPGDQIRSLDIGNRTRTCLIHVPKSYDGKKAVPVIVAFHGGASNAEQMVRFCGLNELSDAVGCLVVYPNGTGRVNTSLTWNGGNCCGYAFQNNVDDVAFVKRLLDDLESIAKVDGKRVYLTGMSNGAIMAYRVASELSERFAAVAPVAGPMGAEKCNPTRPVSVIHFHGTDDEFAPFKGGKGPRSVTQTDFFSVEHTIKAWIRATGCKEGAEISVLREKSTNELGVIRKTFAGGKDGAEVVLIIVEGGGHTWPGRVPALKVLGRSTTSISANEMMWEFFQKH